MLIFGKITIGGGSNDKSLLESRRKTSVRHRCRFPVRLMIVWPESGFLYNIGVNFFKIKFFKKETRIPSCHLPKSVI